MLIPTNKEKHLASGSTTVPQGVVQFFCNRSKRTNELRPERRHVSKERLLQERSTQAPDTILAVGFESVGFESVRFDAVGFDLE